MTAPKADIRVSVRGVVAGQAKDCGGRSLAVEGVGFPKVLQEHIIPRFRELM
jgi:hypothetical protein